MADSSSLIVYLALFPFFAAFLALGVLLIVRPEWTIRQWWSPVNVERMQRYTDFVDYKSLTPGYYRFWGVLCVAFTALIIASLAGWAAGRIGLSIGRRVFLLAAFLYSLAWTLLPFSVLSKMPWLVEGVPADGWGVWRRRVLAVFVLALTGVSLYFDIARLAR